MAETGVGVRRPWQGKKIAVSTEIEGEMAVEEAVIEFLIQSPFKGGFGEGAQWVEELHLDSWANGQIYLKR
jgi:hypothetical protein